MTNRNKNTKNLSQSKQSYDDDEDEEEEPRGVNKNLALKNMSQESNGLSEKQKLIEQNIRLKTQIFDLSRQLDEIMGNEEQRKKKSRIHEDENDELTKAKKLQLKKEQLQVLSLKNKIHAIKRQLQTVHNNRTLVAKEDELKYLRAELDNLEEEKKNLQKIKQEQKKALKVLKNEEQYEQKIEQLKKQLHNVKQESKSLNEKLVESERILRKNHEQFIIKQNKVKDLEQKVVLAQKKTKGRKPVQNITPQMISNLQDEISELQGERKEVERNWHEKITSIDTELREKKAQQEKKLMLLKEKEKELKLNELKIKQLRRLIKHNIAESETKPKPKQMDMHQFRNKRNIKYLNDKNNLI